MRSTSSPSPKSVTTHPVAPTTCANKPRERAAKKPSAHSSEESPTPSGDNYKSTLAPRVESGPGTTPRGDSYIQRGRLNPEHRHFESVSSRTHSNDNPARTRRRQRHHPTRTRTLKPCLLTQRGFDRRSLLRTHDRACAVASDRPPCSHVTRDEAIAAAFGYRCATSHLGLAAPSYLDPRGVVRPKEGL